VRKGNTIFPHADTQLEAGDIIVVMADPASEGDLHSFLGTIESFSEVKPEKKRKPAGPEA
jgi:Trk K+ transport system NAD-binding subunit